MQASSPTGGCGIAGFAFSRLATGPPWVVGEGFIPPAGVCGAVGLPGTMRASSPTGVCYNTEVAVSRLAAGLPWFVGEGHGPPAGVCGGAGFAGGACPSPTCVPATTGHTGRPDARPAENPLSGRIPYPPGSRRRGVARDDASIVPYRGLRHRRVRIFPVGRGPAVGRRGGIYPSRGRLRRRGVRRDEGIPPYGHFIGSAYTGKSACFRRGICGRGMPLPYTPSGNDRPHGKAGYPPGGKPIVGADSISARGVRGAAGLPGTMRASSPTGGCGIAGFAFSRLAAGPPWVVGEGFIPPAGVCGAAGLPGRMNPAPTSKLHVANQPVGRSPLPQFNS